MHQNDARYTQSYVVAYPIYICFLCTYVHFKSTTSNPYPTVVFLRIKPPTWPENLAKIPQLSDPTRLHKDRFLLPPLIDLGSLDAAVAKPKRRELRSTAAAAWPPSRPPALPAAATSLARGRT
jgi:hypothetical protein